MKYTNNSEYRVICAFYASLTFGSEYRSGLEFIRFAAANGFNLAIVADLDENSTSDVLEADAPGIKVIRIPSQVTKQTTLYRYGDVFPQILWHWRVAKYLKSQSLKIHTLWIQNGAQPWLPITHYFGLSQILVWGPVGGGEQASVAMLRRLSLKPRVREYFRSLLQRILLFHKFSVGAHSKVLRIVPIARTIESQRLLSRRMHMVLPVIPEILDPIGKVNILRKPSSTLRLLWVGQDIPRKNLLMALDIFHSLRREAFPNATLDVFGCTTPKGKASEGVTFHGWVSCIDWKIYQNDGVLLLTSFREGLPSALLEAAKYGLLCVSTDVGAIGSLGIPNLYILPQEEYPVVTLEMVRHLVARIQKHLSQTTINFPPVSYQDKLTNFLRKEGVIL